MPQTPERKAQYQRDFRTRQKGTSIEGTSLEGTSLTGARILSDGQLWYPGNYGYHPKECQCKVHPDRTQMTDADYAEMITPRGIV